MKHTKLFVASLALLAASAVPGLADHRVRIRVGHGHCHPHRPVVRYHRPVVHCHQPLVRIHYYDCHYRGWSRYCWLPVYRTYGYFCPRARCWFYYCPSRRCYLPIQYIDRFAPVVVNINNGAVPAPAATGPVTPALPPGAQPLPAGAQVPLPQ